jgi:hypothetical protein
MASNVYKGSKKDKVIQLINLGYSDTHIEEYLALDYDYIKYIRRRNASKIQPAFFNLASGHTFAKLNGKTDTYYKNEMNYGTYKPTYTIREVESEYDTNGKPPTMFGACRVIGRQEC